ncbi:FecR family protein [Bradyrhizobium sp.]|uniref:FecR family protein n=1 Tax=Bradyrhizobium sp. TaxID=376 RepID=UPI0039E2BA95
MDDQKPSWFDPRLEDRADPPTREAVVWFNLLRSERVSERDRVAFRAWLRRDAAHPVAFQEVESLWSGLSDLPEVRRRRRGITRRRFGKGAMSVALAATALWAYRYAMVDYRTGTGERRTVTLADGSRVELSTRTALSASLDGPERRVTLHYGEAYFEVAPKAGRAFVVEAPRGRITALGTAFAVGEDGDRSVVTVTEHAVRVNAGEQALRVEAGMQTVFDAEKISAPVAADASELLAWREGRLVFVNAPLEKVVRVLNRWQIGRVVIMNRSLAQQPVTLIAGLDDVDGALLQLQDALPLSLTRVTPLLTILTARS